MTTVKVSMFDATVECEVRHGRDGWELDDPEDNTTVMPDRYGCWVNPDRIKILDADGVTWRTLTELLLDAAESSDEPPPRDVDAEREARDEDRREQAAERRFEQARERRKEAAE